jgi:hypothetical protein
VCTHIADLQDLHVECLVMRCFLFRPGKRHMKLTNRSSAPRLCLAPIEPGISVDLNERMLCLGVFHTLSQKGTDVAKALRHLRNECCSS